MARLARGGMAEIVLARMGGAGGFEKLVVLKRLLPHLASKQRHVSMFVHEACVVASISHPNVCQVYELGEADGHYNIVMEYLEGAALGQVGFALPPVRGELEVRLIAEIFRQLCAGLHHAHETRAADGMPAGLVHRDVSPQNLFVTFDGVAKVLDFGIAKSIWSRTQTRAGVIIGKVGYLSPEQVRCQQLDRRSDLFSLGVVLHEALTGRPLFLRDSSAETCKAVLACLVPDVRETQPHIPAALAEVLTCTLAARRDDRPATAAELGDRLVAATASLGGPLHAAEVAAWMSMSFADALDERRRQVAAALAEHSRVSASVQSTEVELLTLPPVAPEMVCAITRRSVPVTAGLWPGRVLFAEPGDRPNAALLPADGVSQGPMTQDLSGPRSMMDCALDAAPISGLHSMMDSALDAAPIGSRPPTRPASEAESTPAEATLERPTTPVEKQDRPATFDDFTPGTGTRLRRRRLFAVAAALALASAGVVSMLSEDASSPASGGTRSPPGHAAAAVPAPAPSVPLVLSAPAAPAVLSVPSAISAPSARPVARAVVRPRASPRVATGVPARRPRPTARAGTGWITLDSHPYGEVYVDGTRVGITPLVRHPVTAGSHRVTVKLGDGRKQHFRITVQANKEAPRRRVDW